MNQWKKDIKIARELCEKYDKLKNINTSFPSYPELETKNYVVLEDFEYTTLSDILFVPKLTDADFDREVLKDFDENASLDLDKDMDLDKDAIENQFSVMQSFKTDKVGIPKGRMFLPPKKKV